MTFERNRYSVPASFANRPISLRVYAGRLVFVAEAQVIAEHVRVISRSPKIGRTVYDWRHYLSVLQRKPGALRNGAPFTEMPASLKQLQAILLKRPGGDREMVEILALVLQHDESAVLAAVELALESGAPSKLHVLNLLKRLIEPAPLAPADTPTPLMLVVEPQANVSRYDELREVRHAARSDDHHPQDDQDVRHGQGGSRLGWTRFTCVSKVHLRIRVHRRCWAYCLKPRWQNEKYVPSLIR